MFLYAEGISGEAREAGYQGWTAITSFRWGATQPVSRNSATAFHPLSVNAPLDKAACGLLACCLSGKRLSTVKLAFRKPDSQLLGCCLITLEDVQVTAINYDGIHDGETLYVHYAFLASRVRLQYRAQTTGPEVSFAWDSKHYREY